MPQKIEIALEPYEVVLGAPKLTVRSQSPLDPETTRGALTLANGFRGSVAISRDGRSATFVPDEPLPEGAHTLTISELVSKRGKRVSERIEIPFVVARVVLMPLAPHHQHHRAHRERAGGDAGEQDHARHRDQLASPTGCQLAPPSSER